MKAFIQQQKAWLMLCLLALVWGSSFILIKRGLEVYSPFEVGALRIASAGLFMLPLVIKRLRELNARHWRWLVVSGATGSLLPAFLFTMAQTELSSGITGVLNATTPLFVLLVGLFFFRQPVIWKQSIGLLIGFTGSVLLTLSGGGGLGDINLYALLVILATLCYGTNLNIIKFKLSGLRPVTITGLSLGIFTPPLLIWLLGMSSLTTHLSSTPGAWKALGYVLILGVVGTALALIVFNRLVQISSPIFTSSVTYLIPIVAMTWGVLDGEDLRPIHVLGMLTILTGVYVTNRKKPRIDAQKEVTQTQKLAKT